MHRLGGISHTKTSSWVTLKRFFCSCFCAFVCVCVCVCVYPCVCARASAFVHLYVPGLLYHVCMDTCTCYISALNYHVIHTQTNTCADLLHENIRKAGVRAHTHFFSIQSIQRDCMHDLCICSSLASGHTYTLMYKPYNSYIYRGSKVK
jgi:hypothetical protein